MSKLSERERLVSAIIWAHAPISAREVMSHLVNDWGIRDTMLKGVVKTCSALVHKGLAARQLSTTDGYTFNITPYGEEIACKYLLKTADEARNAVTA